MPSIRSDSAPSPRNVSTVDPARPDWQAADPDAIKCSAYSEHRAGHRRDGDRWRCWLCWPAGYKVDR
jgi:hypothetical protein